MATSNHALPLEWLLLFYFNNLYIIQIKNAQNKQNILYRFSQLSIIICNQILLHWYSGVIFNAGVHFLYVHYLLVWVI